MPQSFAHLPVHFIWSTQGRTPWIDAKWSDALYGVIGGIAKDHKCKLIQAGGIEDHVHLLVMMGREVALATLVREIKSRSSRWIHQTYPALSAFAWQTGYAAFGVSPTNHDELIQYIQNQLHHHRQRTFQEELLDYLHRYGLEYDLQYLWD